MVTIATQTVHGIPTAMAVAATISSMQFLAPSKLRREKHSVSRRRRKLFVVSAKHIGSYLNPTAADKEKEEAMEYRRMVFDHDDWIRHRSSSRHGRHLASIVSSRVIMALGPPVFSLTAVATMVTIYNEALSGQMLPGWLGHLHISSLLFFLTAPALALLLVFRTNASYARINEARKAWGMNVNRRVQASPNFHALPCGRFQAPVLLALCSGIIVYFENHLSQGDELEEDLVGLLEEPELASVLAASHRPNYVLQIMSELVYSTSMSDMERASMDRNLTQFHDNVGACERVFKTPIPLSYTRLTSRFLVIWHIALPLGLWDQCRWLTIPAVFFNAAALLCIEVGVLIEEPFSTLALGSIYNTIKNNVEGLVEAHTEYAHRTSRRSSRSSEAVGAETTY